MNRKSKIYLLSGVFWSLIFTSCGVFGKGSSKHALPPPLSAKIVKETILACSRQVNVTTMSAITKHESNWRPYTIALNKTKSRLSRQPDNEKEAIATAKQLLSLGYNFDMGVAAINSKNLENPALKREGITIDNIFDTCTNVHAAEIILVDCFIRARARYGNERGALDASLSCYNSGNFLTGVRNGYVTKIYAAQQ